MSVAVPIRNGLAATELQRYGCNPVHSVPVPFAVSERRVAFVRHPLRTSGSLFRTSIGRSTSDLTATAPAQVGGSAAASRTLALGNRCPLLPTVPRVRSLRPTDSFFITERNTVSEARVVRFDSTSEAAVAVVTTETNYTLIVTPSCDQVCTDVRWVLEQTTVDGGVAVR